MTKKPEDLNDIRADLDAIQHHMKSILNTGTQMLLEQGSEKASQPIKAIEKQVQKNPLITVLGAFLGGIILGKIFKSCSKKR